MAAAQEPPSNEAVRAPDYPAACDLLVIPFAFCLWLWLLPWLPTAPAGPKRWLVGPLVLILVLLVSDVGWSLAARALERHKGKQCRTISDVLRHALLRIAAPVAIGAIALSVTAAPLLAYGSAAVMWALAEIVVRRLASGLRSPA